MKPSAALLIDLENFVLSRFDYFNDESIRSEDRPSFTEDLKNLVRYAQRMAGLPLAVRRAYADFETLRVDPQDLMRQGVEPVQVFRLSGKSANKNAADMKLAMDAVSLLGSGGHFEHFVLVSGDADFIPVILELKRRGHTVSVIAVTGATNELIQRFVDNFELFEDLVDAEGAKPRVRVGTPEELAKVASALRRLLGRTRPVRFNLVQPLLSKELGYTFDSGAFGCDSAGEFVRKNCAALGIVVRGTHNEQEIDLPGVPVPSSNGTGSKAVPRQAPRPAFELHSVAHYKYLLASGRADANEARVVTVPWASLVWVCDAVVPALSPTDGAPANSMELMARLQNAARATETPDLAAHVALIHSAARSGLVASPEGIYTLPTGADGDELRRRALRYIVYVLGCRLSENKISGSVRVESVVALFDPGPATEQATAEITAALAEHVSATPTPATIPKPAPRTDESHVHTGDGYRKLLQKGGPRGSGETEHMRVHPAPWPSVVRVCADTFSALSPAGTSMQRGQFLERLYAAEKGMCVENYRSHVRRAFALLGLSHAILEETDRVALHPEVSEPGDIRWAVIGIMLKLIAIRLEEKGISERLRPDAFLTAIEAGPYTDEMLPEIAHAVEGMYQAIDGITLEPELLPSEPAPRAELNLEVATDYVTEPSPVIEPEPVPPSTGVEDEIEVITTEDAGTAESSDRDPFAFDGSLPEHATMPAVDEPKPRTAPVDPSASAVDVSALTSAAVAAVVEPAVQVIPAADASTPDDVVPLAEAEVVVFAPLLETPPAPVTPAPDDELPLEAPLAEWLSDDDSIFSDPEFAAAQITERLTGSSTRLPRPPLDYVDDDVLFSDPTFAVERLTGSSTRLPRTSVPAESRVPIARIITPPPLPPSVVQPPPLPPETA